MTKLVILKLDGDVNQGFQVTLSIGRDGEAPEAEVSGYLPPAQELVTDYENWQSTYLSLGLAVRKLKLKKVKIDADINSNTEQLRHHLNRWLGAESFRPLREKWLEKVATEDDVRVLIRTSNQQLRKLSLAISAVTPTRTILSLIHSGGTLSVITSVMVTFRETNGMR